MIDVKTADPSNLVKLIDDGIKKEEIQTWEIYFHEGVKYYTHTPLQWKKKAYLKPEIEQGNLKLHLVWPIKSDKEKAVSGVYHGRFAEMLCSHFPTKFYTIQTNMP